MKLIKTISPSQLDAFDCSLAWYLGWIKGYTPITKRAALELGLGVHYALERYYSKGANPVKVFTRWADGQLESLTDGERWSDDVAAVMDARTMGIAMLEGYLKTYHHKEQFDVLFTEHTMSRKMPHADVEMVVRVDAIVRDRIRDKLFILEHKTFSQFNLDQLARDHQLCAQVWVAGPWMDEPIEGVIYNGLRKQIPSPKTRLELFERHVIYINERQLAVFLKRAYGLYARMSSPGLTIFPQPNVVRCSQCGFREPCTAYCCGDDYKFLLDNFFTRRRDER